MLQPRMLFGLNTNVRKNITYISEEEILYPIGSVIVIHNFKQKSQRYINLPNPEKVISAISVSLKGKCLAVAEKGDTNGKPRIYVYSLETLTRKTTLGIPFEINAQEIMCLTFTHDSHYIAALTGGPDYIMYYYNWRSGKIESQTRANNPPSTPGPVTDMAINPKDATIAVFVGTNLFRLVSMSENVWRQYGFQKAQNYSILSVCWLTDDRVLAGCKDGKMLIIQSGDLNGIYDINDTANIQIMATSGNKKDQLRTLSKSFSKQLSVKQIVVIKEVNDIRCCTAIRSGFLYSRKSGEIIYFEKTSKTSYRKSTTFIIKQDINTSDVDYESLYAINSISTGVDDDIVSCTTNRFQIYWARLRGHESDVIEFKVFEEPLHHGPVAGLSTCLWKPIFMTCGQYDNSVRIWDYLTTTLILNETFIETVISISLHPTGLYALIGFSDKVKYFLVLIHKLEMYREFGIAQSRILSFSNNGHLFAAECEHDIFIYSSITFQKIACFRGHYQEITSLQWSYNDLILYSSSINGAIYEWCIEKNSRLSDIVLQDIAIKGLVTLPGKKIVCISDDGRIIEIQDSKVLTSQKLDHGSANGFNRIIMLENGFSKLLLACENGVIIALNYPIGEEEPEFDTFQMHNSPLTQFCVLQGGRSFVSADTNGNICIWDIKMSVLQEQPCDPFFAEILINVNELREKNQHLNHLTSRITEMITEHSFEMNQKDTFYRNRITELEQSNAQHLQTLKKRIMTMEKEHSMELNRIHLNITQMKQKHTSQIDQMDSNFNGKLLYEFQKYDELQQRMEKMKKEYEKKLKKIEKTRDTEHELHRMQSQKEMTNLQQQLIQLETTLSKERLHFETTLSEMKEKETQEKNALKTFYETTIKEKDSTNLTLKTEFGITKKKLTLEVFKVVSVCKNYDIILKLHIKITFFISILFAQFFYSELIQREKEELKSIKSAYELENENLKQKYIDSLNHAATLKTETNVLEQLKDERRINNKLKDKIKDFTKTNDDFKKEIIHFKKLAQERYDQLITKEEQICKLKREMKTKDKEITELKTKMLHLSGRLRSKEKSISNCQQELISTKTLISDLKRDINSLQDYIQDADNLKQKVQELLKKHVN